MSTLPQHAPGYTMVLAVLVLQSFYDEAARSAHYEAAHTLRCWRCGTVTSSARHLRQHIAGHLHDDHVTELSRPGHGHSDMHLDSDVETDQHTSEASALSPSAPPPPTAGMKRTRSGSSQQSASTYNYNAVPVSVIPDAELRVAKPASYAQRRPKAQDFKDEHSAPFLCEQCGRRYTKVRSEVSARADWKGCRLQATALHSPTIPSPPLPLLLRPTIEK